MPQKKTLILRICSIILSLLSQASAEDFATKRIKLTPTPISLEIKATPFRYFHPKTFETTTTSITFYKAVTLTAPNTEPEIFGGYSSLALSKDGSRITLLSDRGTWASATLTQTTEDSYIFTNATTAALMSAEGKSLHWWSGDSEALSIKGSKACVGFERLHRIACYDYNEKTGQIGTRRTTNRLEFLDRAVPDNNAVESLVLDVATPFGQGDLIILENPTVEATSQSTAYYLKGSARIPINIKTFENFAITDATKLNDTTLLLLERHISLLGPQMRISTLDTTTLSKDTLNIPTLIFKTGLGSPIDNMEAIATYEDSKGRTHIVTISDDNFSKWQSTIMIDLLLEEKIK